MRLFITSALTIALVFGAGCKKDAPKPDEKAAAAAKTADEAGKAGKAAAETAKDKLAGAKAAIAAGTQGAESRGAIAGAGAYMVPEDVVAAAWVPSFDTIFDLVKSKMAQFGVPLPMDKATIIAQATKLLQFKNMDWFATDKAIRVLVWNPKKAQNGLILVPITGKDAFEAALPEAVKKDVEGNAYTFDVMGQKAYVNLVDGFAVLTGDAGLFASAKSAVVDAGKNFNGQGLVDVRVGAKNLRTIFGAELTQARQQLDSIKPMLLKQLEQQMPIPGMGGMEAVIDWYIDMANTVIDDSETVGFSVLLRDKGEAAFKVALSAKAGSKMATFAKSVAGADLSYAEKAPKGSYLVMGSDINPKAFSGMMEYTTAIVGSLLKLSDTEKASFEGQMKTLMNLQTGKSWVAFYADGKFPLAVSAGSQVTDGAAYRKAMDAYMGLLLGKALGLVKEMLPPPLQNLPTDDFPKLVATLNGLTMTAGVKMDAGEVKDGNVTVKKLTITVDVATLSKIAGESTAAKIKQVTDLLGNTLEFALAYGPKDIGMAMGPNGVKTAIAIAKGEGGGTGYGKRFAKGTSVFMHVDISAGLKAFMPVIEMAGAKGEIPELGDGLFFGFAMGADRTDSLTFEMYGSLEKAIAVGVKAFTASMKGHAAPTALPPQQAPKGAAAGGRGVAPGK